MTNADKIRNMTDEELANLLESVEFAGYNDTSFTPVDKDGLYMDYIEWLKEEVD